MRLVSLLTLICFGFFSSQAISQQLEIEEIEISDLKDVEIKEISVREVVLSKDYLNVILDQYESHRSGKNAPLNPIIIPNTDPINKFREVLIFRYFTDIEVQEEEKLMTEARLLLQSMKKIASPRGIKLISIRPTIKITQGQNVYHAEKVIYFYKLENSEWKHGVF